jgi:hypothetical protein
MVYGEAVGHGGGVLCYNLLRRLAQEHVVRFIGFVSAGGSERERSCVADLRKYCESVVVVAHENTIWKRLAAKLRALLSLTPFEASVFASSRMESALKDGIAQFRPNLIWLQFPQMAQYVAACTGCRTIMDVQDAYSVSAFRRARAERSLPKKLYRIWSWLSWVRYESSYYRRFDRVLAITQQDRYGLGVFSPGLKVDVSPAAVEVPSEKSSPEDDAGRIVFMGSFSHAPNVDAVVHFLDAILPTIVQRWPDVEFVVAGRDLPRVLRDRASRQVRFAGYVADLSQFLRNASVVVIPLRFGGGIKVKTLEAMAHGRAVVASSVGAEEIGAVSGEHLIIRDDPMAFAEAVVELLASPQRRRLLGDNAKRLVEQRFSWEAKLAGLNAILASLQRPDPVGSRGSLPHDDRAA